MRILIIHRSFALTGGAERVITDKANFMATQGHSVMLVSYEQGQHPLSYELHPSVRFSDLDCRFFTLSSYSIPVQLSRYFQLRKKFRESLADIIKDFSPDVVVLASDWLMLTDVVASAAKGTPLVTEFHNPYDFVMRKIGTSEGRLKLMLTQLYYRHARKRLRLCERMVVLTERDADCWRKHFDKVSVIPNPVTLYPEAIDDVQKEQGRIIFVGRLNHQKRIERLVSAFAKIAPRHPEWHVDIFGEGGDRDALLRQIAEARLEGRIVIHHPTKTIYDEYKRSQMLVLCSEHEARPLVLVEAMACGVPCVSMDCPYGPSEIIDHGKTGLLARNGDIDDLAEKMEWLIVHDEERATMGRNAREEARKYKQEVIISQWEKLYKEVASTRH